MIVLNIIESPLFEFFKAILFNLVFARLPGFYWNKNQQLLAYFLQQRRSVEGFLLCLGGSFIVVIQYYLTCVSPGLVGAFYIFLGSRPLFCCEGVSMSSLYGNSFNALFSIFLHPSSLCCFNFRLLVLSVGLYWSWPLLLFPLSLGKIEPPTRDSLLTIFVFRSWPLAPATLLYLFIGHLRLHG